MKSARYAVFKPLTLSGTFAVCSPNLIVISPLPSAAGRTRPDGDRVFSHYVTLLERHPERLELEQSHLYAAMEHAYRKNDMNALLRIEELARKLDDVVS